MFNNKKQRKYLIEGYEDAQIVIFDGVCNFCHAGINFIIKHDSQGKIKHSPAQSEFGQWVQKRLGIDVLAEDTSIFYDRGYVYTKCYGGLQSCKYLDPLWLRAFSMLRFLPSFILDPVYHYIAKNRYRWYGKKDQCMIPTDDIKQRFL